MQKVSNIVFLTAAVGLFCVGCATETVRFEATQTEAGESGGAIEQPGASNNRCGAGFRKTNVRAPKQMPKKPNKPLRYDNDFYGYTFESNRQTANNPVCNKFKRVPQDIEFVDDDVNKELRVYISAVMFNEVNKRSALKRVEGRTESELGQDRFEMCGSYECGLSETESKPVEISFVTSGNIEARYLLTDDKLTMSIVEALRAKKTEDGTRLLSDSEAGSLVRAARDIGIANARQIRETVSK